MVNKLHAKLTLFNTAVTGLLLLGMVLLCLVLSERNTRSQTMESFWGSVDTVCDYLQSQSKLSDIWLRQMEGSRNLQLSIQDGGKDLFSMGLSSEKKAMEPVFRQAQRYAGERTNQESQCFWLTGEDGQRYCAAVARIRKGETVLQLTALHPLAQMEQGIRKQRLTVCLAALGALVLLGAFSWVFTGKMLAPIAENQKRQAAFVAAASHELRTPLTAMLSAASAMERAEPEQRGQFLTMIQREGSRMGRLIGEMLTLASSDSRSWGLHLEPVEPDMLLLEVYESQYPLAKEKGLQLELSLYQQEIPTLWMDRDRLQQVLLILLENARSVTPAPGKIELELRRCRNRVRISVSDTGPGVPEEEREKIFERFYRGEQGRSDRGHFGLGLSIAAEIVKQHQGRLWVQDAPGGGAEFVVELPVTDGNRKEKPKAGNDD